jgi:hypothetical protein
VAADPRWLRANRRSRGGSRAVSQRGEEIKWPLISKQFHIRILVT